MKRVLTSILVVLNLTAFAQPGTGAYTLTVNYSPSFITSSVLTIHSEKNVCYAQLDILKDYYKKNYWHSKKKSLKLADIDSLKDFFQTYQFRIRSSTDTLGSSKIFENGDSVVVYHLRTGLDGIIVKGILDDGQTPRKFQFWSPKNRHADSERLAGMLINIMQKTFTDKISAEYIRALKTYFD